MLLRMKREVKMSIHKSTALGYLNMGLCAVRAFDTHLVNC